MANPYRMPPGSNAAGGCPFWILGLATSDARRASFQDAPTRRLARGDASRVPTHARRWSLVASPRTISRRASSRLPLPISGGEYPGFEGFGDGGGGVRDFEFNIDALDVLRHGVGGDFELCGNLFLHKPIGQ